ncbi:helix-turn-helix domain-containing protein [Streptomyces noursei]|uniref:helix-turn-helix domain-containing protein n=1 Tax=Streptomyces noursei TaxID=1971 RepID=UPI000C9AB191
MVGTDCCSRVVALWVGGCRDALSAFILCAWFFRSSFVAATVGGGASCPGGRVVQGGWVESEIARAVGVCPESVRRWRRLWEEGGAPALRRHPATGRPPKLNDVQVETVRAALEQGAKLMDSRPICGPWNESAWSSSG